jgi:hypothetical protein
MFAVSICLWFTCILITLQINIHFPCKYLSCTEFWINNMINQCCGAGAGGESGRIISLVWAGAASKCTGIHYLILPSQRRIRNRIKVISLCNNDIDLHKWLLSVFVSLLQSTEKSLISHCTVGWVNLWRNKSSGEIRWIPFKNKENYQNICKFLT